MHVSFLFFFPQFVDIYLGVGAGWGVRWCGCFFFFFGILLKKRTITEPITTKREHPSKVPDRSQIYWHVWGFLMHFSHNIISKFLFKHYYISHNPPIDRRMHLPLHKSNWGLIPDCVSEGFGLGVCGWASIYQDKKKLWYMSI